MADNQEQAAVQDPPDTAHTIVPEGSLARPASEPLTDEVLQIDPQVAEKRDGPEAQMSALREEMGITETVDPLMALLNAPIGPQKSTWKSKRLGVEFEIRSLNNDDYAKAQEQATRFVRNRRSGRMEKDVDGATLSFLVCVAGCVNPNFESQEVKKRFNAMNAQDALKKGLLPGEIDQLAEKILQLSGFDEDVEEQGKD
jgi:hypothetical protein